jgi:hypothetical protein
VFRERAGSTEIGEVVLPWVQQRGLSMDGGKGGMRPCEPIPRYAVAHPGSLERIGRALKRFNLRIQRW